MAPVPGNEVYHLLTVRTKRSEVSEGMWARVKSGKYKGDLAQVDMFLIVKLNLLYALFTFVISMCQISLCRLWL